jgi:hypothetical protein
MKRLLLSIFLLAFLMLAGCSGMSQSDFLQHKTMYESWGHMAFSWYGYRHPTTKDIKNSNQQHWWGVDVPYVPGQ